MNPSWKTLGALLFIPYILQHCYKTLLLLDFDHSYEMDHIPLECLFGLNAHGQGFTQQIAGSCTCVYVFYTLFVKIVSQCAVFIVPYEIIKKKNSTHTSDSSCSTWNDTKKFELNHIRPDKWKEDKSISRVL